MIKNKIEKYIVKNKKYDIIQNRRKRAWILKNYQKR